MNAGERTISDHKERLDKVLVHIRDHMDEPLSLFALASVACFSPFHFHRIFSAYTGETLGGYIRRIRLERAALRLRNSADPVTEIALSAGYETPASFAKAFRQHFRMTPTEFKSGGESANLGLLGEVDFKIGDKSGNAKAPVIRILEEQMVYFVRKTGRFDRSAAEAWTRLMKFAYPRRLMTKATRCIGVSHDFPEVTPEDKIRYDACITADGDAKPEEEIGVKAICGGTHAVFLHKGPYDRLSESYGHIFSEWVPASGRKLRDAPCFELYLNRDPCRTKPENLRTEIHVPVE